MSSLETEAPCPALDLSLAPGTEAPRAARGGLLRLRHELGHVLTEHAGVLASELVAGHGASHLGGGAESIGLRAWVHADRLCVEVQNAELDAERRLAGRGLDLIERLSDRWGIVSGKPLMVWFELGRTAPRPSN